MRARGIIRIGTCAVVAVGLAVGLSAPSSADSLNFRQLQGPGLIAVLPQPNEYPLWLGAKQYSLSTESFTPEAGMSICEVGISESVEGQKPSLGAYSFVDYGAYPSGGFANLLTNIYQFPNAQAARAAWANLNDKAKACTTTFVGPYQFAGTERLGDVTLRQKVRTSDPASGTRGLIIDSRSSWKRYGATNPDRTGGQWRIWRQVGNVVFKISYVKVVDRDVPTVMSASDRATINALSLLVVERYRAAALGA